MTTSKSVASILMWLLLSGAVYAIPVSRIEGMRVMEHYQSALQSAEISRISSLIAPDARIRVQLQQKDATSQVFTLSTQRFVQQIGALARFSSEQYWKFSAPEYINDGNGRLKVLLTQTQHRKLFGSESAQRDSITLLLDRRNDQILIIDIHAVSEIW